jgi:glycosyltransferase involved in cell wall biosynthesis
VPIDEPAPPGLRVLLVTKGLDLGGIERIVVDLAVGFAARDVDVEVALVNPTRDRLVPALIDAGITVHELGGTDLIGLGAARRLTRLVRRGEYDVVHAHGPLPAVVARLAGLGARTHVITTAHTEWRSLRRPTRIAWAATARVDDRTLAVSSAVAASLPRRPASRALVIPHGVDLARIRAAADAAMPRRAVDPDEPVTVVTVASHRDVKNYPNLLHALRDALAAGARVRLVAIGDGPGLRAHETLVAELGIADAVEFRPASDDALALIAAADLLVVASDHEGQPLVVAEALALGVPVVATAVGRVPEMIDHAVGRVVPPRNPTMLADALRELADDAALRHRLGAAAGQRPVRCIADVVDDHLAVFRSRSSRLARRR